MGLMPKSMFEGYADRMAKQYSYMKVCFNTLANTGTGEQYYDRFGTANDPDVQLNMLTYSNTADIWFRSSSTLMTVVRSFTNFTNLIRGFEAALRSDGTLSSKTFDGYCAYADTRVSDNTNQVYYAANSVYMLAKNVWCEDEKTLGSAEMTGSSTLTFTVGDTLYVGTYSATQKADGTYFGAASLKARITGSNTIGSLVVNVIGRNAIGSSQTVAATITGAPGAEVNIGTTEKFLDVTSITRTSGGSTGDMFIVVNTPDRIIEM